MREIFVSDLGLVEYRQAWDYQEYLLEKNVQIKSAARRREQATGIPEAVDLLPTVNHLLLLEHPPVYTLGKSGHTENILISEAQMHEKGIAFFKTNRGGDITFHGPGQLIGYPVIDLEKLYTDIGRYLRNMEEVIIRTLAEYDIAGGRSAGETGVWLEPGMKGSERKICAIGVRCSRWITMHGFAFNVNTDLAYFDHIIPCGIQNKQVTSLQKELGYAVSLSEIKEKVIMHFEAVFGLKAVPVQAGSSV